MPLGRPPEHRPAKLKKKYLDPLAVQTPTPMATAKELLAAIKPDPESAQTVRGCCATPPRDGPHAAGCANHPDTPRKPPKLSPAGMDAEEAGKGRWPNHTIFEAKWVDETWGLRVIVLPCRPSSDMADPISVPIWDRAFKGLGIHKLLSQAFREFLASRPKPDLSSSHGHGTDV